MISLRPQGSTFQRERKTNLAVLGYDPGPDSEIDEICEYCGWELHDWYRFNNTVQVYHAGDPDMTICLNEYCKGEEEPCCAECGVYEWMCCESFKKEVDGTYTCPTCEKEAA